MVGRDTWYDFSFLEFIEANYFVLLGIFLFCFFFLIGIYSIVFSFCLTMCLYLWITQNSSFLILKEWPWVGETSVLTACTRHLHMACPGEIAGWGCSGVWGHPGCGCSQLEHLDWAHTCAIEMEAEYKQRHLLTYTSDSGEFLQIPNSLTGTLELVNGLFTYSPGTLYVIVSSLCPRAGESAHVAPQWHLSHCRSPCLGIVLMVTTCPSLLPFSLWSLSFVVQKLFSQPSVVLQEVLFYMWVCIWCVRGGEFGVFMCHHLGLPPPDEEA